MILRLLACSIAITATGLTWYSSWDCRFFTVTDDNNLLDSSSNSSNTTTTTHSYGIFLAEGNGVDIWKTLQQEVKDNSTDAYKHLVKDIVEGNHVCQPYNAINPTWNTFFDGFDVNMWVAFVSGVLALLFSLGVFAVAVTLCCINSDALISVAGGSAVITLCTGLEFVALRSRLCVEGLTCQVGSSGKVAMYAMAAWVVLIPISLGAAALMKLSQTDAEKSKYKEGQN